MTRRFAAIRAEEVFEFLDLLIGKVHALGMEPFATEVTFDVQQIGIKGLVADAKFVPVFECWLEFLA